VTKTAKEVEQDLEHRREKKGGGGKHDWLGAFPVGTTFIRIGPPWKDKGEVWKDVLFHGHYPKKKYCKQMEKDKHGKTLHCPVEDAKKELKGEKSKYSRKLWGLLSQKGEGLWNVLVAKTKDDEPRKYKYKTDHFQILRLSSKWHEMLLEVFADEDYRKKHILGVSHAKYGRLIRVKRRGKEMDDTSYSFKAMDESRLADSSEDREKLLKTLNDLDDVVKVASTEELETYVRHAKKKAKHMAKHSSSSGSGSGSESESGSGSGSGSASSASGSGSGSGSSSGSSSGSGSSSDSGDLEKQYKEMKKKMKDRGKHH
jgi:hypothetical protein